MTPAVLVIAVVLAALAGAWLTRPWWRTTAMPARMAVPIDTAPRSRALHLTVATLALVAIAALAWWGIDRAGREADPRPPSAALQSAAAIAQVKATIERLQAQAKAQPEDAKAWETLGVSHAALGHQAEALQALRRAQQLRPDDATVLAETALSLVIADPKSASGEPTALVTRALALDPTNHKALALAGTLALQRHDYVQAVKHWEALARVEPPDTPAGRQLQVGLAEARSRVALVAARSASSASGKNGAATAPRISGTVSLAAGLRAKVEPEDTVFVYARSLDAAGPPLAVVKRQVRDLPFGFTLDDSASMTGARLSSADRVAIGARVSKSGQPVAHPGDLEGRISPVMLGSADVKVEIDTVVPVKP